MSDLDPLNIRCLTGPSDNIFQRCVEASNEAMMITDLEGRLAYVNPAWCNIYGYSRQEALGSTPRLLHSGVHDREFYSRMWADILNPAIGRWRGEVTNRTLSGANVAVLLTIAPLKEGAKVIGYMGIAVDIRELKEFQAKVLQQDRLASIGLLASGLAHEIGTPLAVARGRAELVARRVGTDAVASADVQSIVDQIDRISQLIKSLLRFNRASNAAVEELRPTNLRAVIKEVESLASPIIRGARIELRIDIPADLLVIGDDQRLQQIFLNLTINAIHAVEEAQQRDAGNHRPQVVSVSVEPSAPNAAFVEVVVRDSGCGIAAEDLPKIFQPFFTTKEVGRGTGLGLPIVIKLADELGGDVKVLSAQNVGSAFHVRLRRAD